MKKLIYLFSIVAAMLFAGCESNDEPNNDTPQDEVKSLVGSWYGVDENAVITMTLFEDGTASYMLYLWDGAKWAEASLAADYTVNTRQHQLFMQVKDFTTTDSSIELDAVKNIAGSYAVTDTSLTLTVGGESLTLKKYSGNKADIADVFKDIEENWLDEQPDYAFRS